MSLPDYIFVLFSEQLQFSPCQKLKNIFYCRKKEKLLVRS